MQETLNNLNSSGTTTTSSATTRIIQFLALAAPIMVSWAIFLLPRIVWPLSEQANARAIAYSIAGFTPYLVYIYILIKYSRKRSQESQSKGAKEGPISKLLPTTIVVAGIYTFFVLFTALLMQANRFNICLKSYCPLFEGDKAPQILEVIPQPDANGHVNKTLHSIDHYYLNW